MEMIAALRLIEDIPEANSYDPYTCQVRDSFFYECLDIASPKTLSSSINGSYGVGASSTLFTWLSDGLNTSSINHFGGAARCHDKVTGDGAVNSFDVAVLMYYQFEMPPYGRANLPRTPAEVRTVDGRHDTWKRCGTNETRAGWQLTVADDYCALSEDNTNYAQPPLAPKTAYDPAILGKPFTWTTKDWTQVSSVTGVNVWTGSVIAKDNQRMVVCDGHGHNHYLYWSDNGGSTWTKLDVDPGKKGWKDMVKAAAQGHT